MPLVDFPLCLIPVRQVRAVLAAALMPQLVGALGNLFFQAHGFVYV